MAIGKYISLSEAKKKKLVSRFIKAMAQEIIDGKWDDTPEEAEAWAAAQTGEMREVIDKLCHE